MSHFFAIFVYNTKIEFMDFKKLNKEQKAAVKFDGKHLLLLAGAGTGKTATIVSRATWLIENGIAPSRIKIISFTKKSANEIASRTASLLANNGIKSPSQGATFHGWCLEIIRSNPAYFNMNAWTVIDTDDQEIIIKHILADKTFCLPNGIKASDILSIHSYQLNTDCNLEKAIRKTLTSKSSQSNTETLINDIGSVEAIIKLYEKYKNEHLYLDYDDILTITVNTLTQNKELYSKVTSMYDHILVDEMQDTNQLQWKLLEFFMPSCHLFCVGDDAQSIYGFRGADFNSIHSFGERVPGSTIMKLTKNYRSSQAILDVSNQLLNLSPLQYNKELTAANKKGKKPLLVFVNNKYEEAAFIQRDVQKHIEAGERYASHMILARNAYQAKQIEASFLTNQIPYVLFGGISLLKSAHVRDVISVLRIIANPQDELAWMRFLELWPGIGKAKMRKAIESIITKKSITEMVDFLMTIEIFALPAKTINNAYLQASSTAACLASATKSIDTILKDKYAKDWERRKKDLASLIEVASHSKSIISFINDFLVDSNINGKDSRDDAVIVSTIHSAKGLEADYCYVIDMNIGNYPCDIAIKEGTNAIEEERRCLYVALTRAKKQLAVTTEYNTWMMTKPFQTKITKIKVGDTYVAIHPTPSNPPYKTAKIVSINGNDICFHVGSKTLYKPFSDFIAAYKSKEEISPGLSIPQFFFSKINTDLFECISGIQQPTAEKTIIKNNSKFNLFT